MGIHKNSIVLIFSNIPDDMNAEFELTHKPDACMHEL